MPLSFMAVYFLRRNRNATNKPMTAKIIRLVLDFAATVAAGAAAAAFGLPAVFAAVAKLPSADCANVLAAVPTVGETAPHKDDSQDVPLAAGAAAVVAGASAEKGVEELSSKTLEPSPVLAAVSAAAAVSPPESISFESEKSSLSSIKIVPYKKARRGRATPAGL